jgi:hypothetical protein
MSETGFTYVSLADVAKWAEIPAGKPVGVSVRHRYLTEYPTHRIGEAPKAPSGNAGGRKTGKGTSVHPGSARAVREALRASGVMPTNRGRIAPEMIARFSELHPDVELDVTLAEQLRRYRLNPSAKSTETRAAREAAAKARIDALEAMLRQHGLEIPSE